MATSDVITVNVGIWILELDRTEFDVGALTLLSCVALGVFASETHLSPN